MGLLDNLVVVRHVLVIPVNQLPACSVRSSAHSRANGQRGNLNTVRRKCIIGV